VFLSIGLWLLVLVAFATELRSEIQNKKQTFVAFRAAVRFGNRDRMQQLLWRLVKLVAYLEEVRFGNPFGMRFP
jgi:hypothetical protein